MSWEMSLIYLTAALIGGMILVIQLFLALLGIGLDVDLEAGEAGEGGLSFRTAVAFITFFGIGGMAASRAEFSPTATLIIALLCGGLAFWLVGLIMLQIARLQTSGNLDIQKAEGLDARVYVTIPAEKEGAGKVTVSLQGRSVQLRAVTLGPEIRSGSRCRIVAVRSDNTVVVESPERAPETHPPSSGEFRPG